MSSPLRLTGAATERVGFMPVMRSIPHDGVEAVGPVLFLDHFGPVTLPPGNNARLEEHPHAGIETVTYLLDGSFEHRDSLGTISEVDAYGAQWMRSGRGIQHSEEPSPRMKRDGGLLEGLQIWLDMPPDLKTTDTPVFSRFDASDLPEFTFDGGFARLLAGTHQGKTGPLVTHTGPFLLHLKLQPGASFVVENQPGEDRAIYVVRGSLALDNGSTAGPGHLAFPALSEAPTTVKAGPEGLDAMVLGGPPLAAPIVRYGPFVMNSREDMALTFKRYQNGEMGRVP